MDQINLHNSCVIATPAPIKERFPDLMQRSGISIAKGPSEASLLLSKGEAEVECAFEANADGDDLFLLRFFDSGPKGVLFAELERMQFASGAVWHQPASEFRISTDGEVQFAAMCLKFQKSISDVAVSDQPFWTARLPYGIVLHFGASVDPQSGAPRCYAAIKYAKFCLAPFRRRRTLQVVRKILKEFGFADMRVSGM